MLWCSVVQSVYVIKMNLIQYLYSVYFIIQPLHVSGIFVAHHQEVHCVYTTIGRVVLCSWLSVGLQANRQSTKKWENLRERDHSGDPDVDGRIILRWILRKWEGVVGTGWSWLRLGTGGGHLWVRWGTFGFQKCGEFLD